ncbi:hypothetical protein BOTCAL_0008g00330 [Botryotinia calthae]|uniref:Uncharacterized protein n=1 Tax=Botryotinia calthae TaxID=38488 RepID=A0A4Y8DJ26_9HELO|nr:hypothetical protein BOTCAL_0008g00330 [Botryotinia calthae]
MADQKIIQRCQLSSTANCFLNCPLVQNNNEPIPRGHPTAPYYAGQNWKSAMSAATELDERNKIMTREHQRVRAQIEDSINIIDLCHKKAEKVKPECKKKELVQRGSAAARSVPAHLQTPFVPNPTPNPFATELPGLIGDSNLSEHTGSLELPLHRKTEARSALYLHMQRISFITNECKTSRFSAEHYNKCMSNYEFPNPDSPDKNGTLFNKMLLFLSDTSPTTLTEIQAKILNGTEEEKKNAKIELSEMDNTYRRERTTTKSIIRAEIYATRARHAAARLVESKTTNSFRETISQFEDIKERGGEAYLKIKHHLSAVPEYVTYEFRNERQMGTGLWNAIGPGNGVKRGRPGSMWRENDLRGMHSSLRMVSNASSDFQEEYVTKASSGPPTSIHPVDDLPELLEEESNTEESNTGETESDDDESDYYDSDDYDSDDYDSDDCDSDDFELGEDELVDYLSEEDYWIDFKNRYGQ